MIGWQEALPIVVVIVVLFGAKKLPELGKSLGQGIKEFKKSTKDIMKDDDEDPAKPKAESSDA
jgi:sec-independent protein translocase protein TatA